MIRLNKNKIFIALDSRLALANKGARDSSRSRRTRCAACTRALTSWATSHSARGGPGAEEEANGGEVDEGGVAAAIQAAVAVLDETEPLWAPYGELAQWSRGGRRGCF